MKPKRKPPVKKRKPAPGRAPKKAPGKSKTVKSKTATRPAKKKAANKLPNKSKPKSITKRTTQTKPTADLFELTAPVNPPTVITAPAILDQRLMLPQKVCAIAFDVSVEALKKWRVKPRGKIGRETLYYLPDLVSYRLARDESGRLNLTDARARLSSLQADRVALELETMRANLIPADVLLQTWEPLVAAARAKVLSIPSKLKTAIPKLTDKDLKKIRKIARESLESIAKSGLSKKSRSHNRTPV